jgi:methionine biosynthesis protein MetW
MIVFRKAKSLSKIFKKDMKYIFNYPAIVIKKMDYDHYWEEMGDINIKERTRIFSRLIKPGSSVLDIGCGTGTNLKYLVENNNIIAEGIDISTNAIEIAKNRGIKAWVADTSQKEFILDRKYDYIIISELIEHIPNPEGLLSKIQDNFNFNLIVSIPNIGFYRHRLRLLFGRFPIQWAFHPGEHLRFWTFKDFLWWLKQIDYKVEGYYPAIGSPVLYKYLPYLFAHSVVYALNKAERNKG